MWVLCLDLAFRTTFSRSIPIVVCARISFLSMAGPYSIVNTQRFVYLSSIDGRWVASFRGIVNRADVSVPGRVLIYTRVFISLGGTGIVGLIITL